MQLNAFDSRNNLSVAQLPTVASQAFTLTGPTGNTNGTQVRIVNRNTQDVWFVWATGGAAVTCTVPTVGSNANGQIILSGEDAIFTPPAGTTGGSTAQLVPGTGNIYFTVGEGL